MTFPFSYWEIFCLLVAVQIVGWVFRGMPAEDNPPGWTDIFVGIVKELFMLFACAGFLWMLQQAVTP